MQNRNNNDILQSIKFKEEELTKLLEQYQTLSDAGNVQEHVLNNIKNRIAYVKQCIEDLKAQVTDTEFEDMN